MQTVVGVRFKPAGKIYYFGTGGLEFKKGEDVIAETVRGLEYGHIILEAHDVEDTKVPQPLRNIVRLATDADREIVAENMEKEKEAFKICLEKIVDHDLPMKLVNVEYTFDVNKIVFYFTADGRIDFRELVKDLAAVFRTRIELRQIGVRDEAKMMGGIGGCGRPLCCATFLDEFVPVSIRMAKEQSISLNPTKISGICGRLMCCLKYENDCYVCRRKEQRRIPPPRQGSRVATMEGEGKVISINEQRRTATILLDDSKTIVASWEDIVEKDDEDVTAEEMAAAIAVATMLNEKERAGKKRSEPEKDKSDGNSEDIYGHSAHEGEMKRPSKGSGNQPSNGFPTERGRNNGQHKYANERKKRIRYAENANDEFDDFTSPYEEYGEKFREKIGKNKNDRRNRHREGREGAERRNGGKMNRQERQIGRQSEKKKINPAALKKERKENPAIEKDEQND